MANIGENSAENVNRIGNNDEADLSLLVNFCV